jgi:hypothetical protein
LLLSAAEPDLAFNPSMSACIASSLAIRSAREGWLPLSSPMTGREEVSVGDGSVGLRRPDFATEEVEAADWEVEEDRLTLDTRLSRVLNPKVAGPRL